MRYATTPNTANYCAILRLRHYATRLYIAWLCGGVAVSDCSDNEKRTDTHPVLGGCRPVLKKTGHRKLRCLRGCPEIFQKHGKRTFATQPHAISHFMKEKRLRLMTVEEIVGHLGCTDRHARRLRAEEDSRCFIEDIEWDRSKPDYRVAMRVGINRLNAAWHCGCWQVHFACRDDYGNEPDNIDEIDAAIQAYLVALNRLTDAVNGVSRDSDETGEAEPIVSSPVDSISETIPANDKAGVADWR